MHKVLVVDDSQELLLLFTTLLKMKGFDTETASSKNIMLNRLSTFIPDLILLDVRLNGSDGRQLCREIKENNSTKDIPIILLSASPELLKDYEECYAFDIIEKPFDLTTVIQKIERAITNVKS